MRNVLKNFNLQTVLKLFSIQIILAICFLNFTKCVYAEEDNPRILFLSSYSESFESDPPKVEGARFIFQDKYDMDFEFMDSKRFETLENRELFYQLLKYKLSNVPTYDAVIVSDDYALQFVMDYQDELFINIPIIFIAINDKQRAEEAAARENIAGVWEETSLTENIDLARKFNPDATKVMAIVDSTLTGQGDQKQFEEAMLEFPDLQAELLNVSNYDINEVAEMLDKLEDDTILLFLSMNQTKDGVYIALDDQIEFLKEHTNIPVYRASLGGVGQGLFGGKLIDYYGFGELGAKLVIEVLNGKSIDSIDLIRETPYYYTFDYELVKKYGINEELIPADAVLVNKEERLIEKYRDLFITIGIILVFLSLVSVILIIDNLKRRKAERDLKEKNLELKKFYKNLSKTEEELRFQYEIVQEHANKMYILNQKFKIATESTNSAVWEMNIESKQVMISESFGLIFDQRVKTHCGYDQFFGQVLCKSDKIKLDEEICRYLSGGSKEINLQVCMNNKNWMLVKGKGVYDQDDHYTDIHGLLIDSTKIKEQEAYIEYLAAHDYLTNLPNRHQFLNRLNQALKDNVSGAVILFDVDNFKSINDSLGHVYGDLLLKSIAERLRYFQNESVMVARFGGDEFLVLYLGSENCSEISKFAETIRSVFKEGVVIDGVESYFSISMGITCFPRDSRNINQLIMNADTAMYKIKRNGKNDLIFFHENMNQEMKDKHDTEIILREAIKNDGFKLLYQPQISSESGEIISFEALIRLKNYQIRPDIFIGVAEETGLIVEIGRWVAKETVNQMKIWQEKGFSSKAVAINFSIKQLRDSGYIDYLNQMLSERSLDPSLIEIEITENILLENNSDTFDFLNELKNSGFRIALDDFGTGYASFNYLTYIPVDKVKLDKSINDKFLKHENSAVIESLINLVHSLKLEITAEGIETWDKYAKLRASNCDYIQGYLFSRPLEPEKIEEIYNKNMIELFLENSIN
ncbi:ABC transporter substrate binding protein [Eubacteriaceae bacterium ES3]|nr:ABC transporter substrate binding protein [Eubacteriaceae bacterium ES3]